MVYRPRSWALLLNISAENTLRGKQGMKWLHHAFLLNEFWNNWVKGLTEGSHSNSMEEESSEETRLPASQSTIPHELSSLIWGQVQVYKIFSK